MDVVKSLAGMVQVQLISADPAAAISAVYRTGIPIYRADREEGDIVIHLTVHRRDLESLRSLADRKGYEVKLDHRWGLYWSVKQALKRPVLTAGMLVLLVLSIWLPSRVLFFRVEGAQTIPEQLILEKCQQCGISFGASRRAVRSEKMKNALLGAIPELQWAGINTSGCVATISVRERTQTDPPKEQAGVSSIVALRDGVVTQSTVIRGNGVCKVGQAVKAGEVLISGYTDLGISIQATRAEGEVFARTDRELEVRTLSVQREKGEKQRSEKKYALIIGKKRINFYKGSGISGGTCDKMYSEYWLTLPGGFRLPVALVTEIWTTHDYTSGSCDEESTTRLLQNFANGYLRRQMIAGTVLNRREQLEPGEGIYTLKGKYACTEMIGKAVNEEIVKPNGEND